MGFRFRRSIRVLPGIRLNIGKRGISTSIGGRGAHVTLGHGRIRETVSIPGSGLSYTESQSTRQAHGDDVGTAQVPDGHEHRSIFGRVLRWLAWGIVGAWCVSVAIIWAIARFWPGP